MKSSQKILVVEDQTIIALDIKYTLEAEGYVVDTNYKSVENVFEIIENDPPNLVLIDINLNEERTGIDIGNYLLKKDTLPFIYITSNSDKVTLEKVKGTRPYGFIVKPYKKEDLISTVYLVMNNFQYRRIDLLRTEKVEKIDIPIQLKQTLEYIEQHVTKKIDVAQLAALTRWDTAHYSRVFKQYMGLTPYQYILKKKIEASLAVIVSTNEQLQYIADDFGFSSYSNFCNAFKKIIHSSPESYRFEKQSRNNRDQK
ncbi:MAG: response regulator transcription factor [Flavobacterium sp.]|nr:response regulator transcription factor [Flavobacterium sp.]